MPTAAFLSFTPYRASILLGLRDHSDPQALAAGLRRADRRELARHVSGRHSTREDAMAHAREQGPMLVLTPEGEVLQIERVRDAAICDAIAREQREYAERLRRMTVREERGASWQRETRGSRRSNRIF